MRLPNASQACIPDGMQAIDVGRSQSVRGERDGAVPITEVAELGLDALRAEWERQWGEAPKFRSRDLLARAMTYRQQAEIEGDLSTGTRRRINELSKQFTLDRRYSPIPGHDLKPGTALIREWHGIRHEVAVTDSGFQYQGQVYRSLSAVAGHITGCKWNGYAFFGLKR